MKGYHKHHIVFRSQGGLDFDLNFAFLTPEQHRELHDNDHNMDLKLKKELQEKLFLIFVKDTYTLEEIIEKLGLKRRQAEKAFKRVACIGGEYQAENIIRRLMGGKLYL